MPSNEQKLKILECQRQLFFERMQNAYDLSRNLNDPSAIDSFLCSIVTLDEVRSNFQQCITDINTLSLKIEKGSEPDFNQWLAFEDLYCRVKRKHSQLEPKSSSSMTKQNVNHDSSAPNVKLARIEIPEFDGSSKDWPLFYATFQSAVHLNTSLNDTERMFYLASKLTGKAKSVYAGFIPSAENYSTIYSALIDRYQDKRNLAVTYLDQMFSLKPVLSATANNLETLIDQFSNSYLALNNLKLPNLCDFIILHALSQRLDKETTQLFEMENRGKDIPTLDSLISFVHDRIKVLNRTGDNNTNANTSSAKGNKNASSSSSNKGTARSFMVNNSKATCPLCENSDHDRLYSCPKFKSLAPRERFNYIKKLRACVNCLSLQHNTRSCGSKSTCKQCGSKFHHSLLHFPDSNGSLTSGDNASSSTGSTDPIHNASSNSSSNSVSNNQADNAVALCSMSASNKNPRKTNNVLLGTALADVKCRDGSIAQVRMLIDNGSQNHFITRRACKRLGIRIFNDCSDRSVNGLGNCTQTISGIANITLHSKYDNTFSLPIQPLVLKTISSNLPSCQFDISSLTYLGNLQLADPNFQTPADIDLLLGADTFMEILRPGKLLGPPGKPDVLESAFGYLVFGSIASLPCHNNSPSISQTFFSSSEESIETLVANFLQLESVPSKTHISKAEQECEDFYVSNTHRDNESGRYVTALPFSQPTSLLGDSLTIASRRYTSLERRFQTNTALKIEYDNVMRDYLERNIISLAPASTTDKDYYVIPHHAVTRPDKPVRIVLNASQKCVDSNISLNDCLHSGANLQANLTAIILKFRLFPVALTADIKQMFLAIGIREKDRRFLNIFYKFDEDANAQLYHFNRVCFGLRCSPYLAMRTVKQLAQDETDLPLASEIAINNLYMDDLGVSVASAEDGTQLALDLIELFKRGNFDLVKFVSNSSEVLKSIPINNRLSSNIEFDKEDHLKLLGLIWSPTEDEFSIAIKFNPQSKCTKRLMLSTIARLWDINGFCAPVILHAKLLIKALWAATPKIDWDDTPPRDICMAWNRFLTELPALKSFKIPRFLGVVPASRVILIGFADASEKAMGAAVYLCVHSTSGPNDVNLIGAKSKVAPLRNITLARLELSALLLLSKLFRFVIDVVSSRCHIDEIFAFTDSTVALHWVHSSPHRFDTFVANRIAQIQDNLSSKHFYHCESAQNPSDCISRGLTPAQLLDHPLWLHGPTWARDPVHTWPISRFIFDPAQDEKLLELKKQSNVFITTDVPEPFLCAISKRVSSWSKFLRIVVYIYRFLGKLPRSNRMMLSHLDFAETAVIKALQQQYFASDINALSKSHKVSKSLLPLSPFLASDILRVGGRLEKSSLEFDSKHPILLPKRDHIVNLIIDYYHRKYLHAGPQLLLSLLRQKFWIISGRSTVKQRFRLCNRCFKTNPRTEAPFMAALPAPRVNEAKPFFYCGVDYAGPINCLISRYRGARKEKAYICLFTCLVTRACHIEVAVGLDSKSYIRALRRFISRRGKIVSLFSDNGTNFIGAKAQLDELNGFLKSRAFRDSFEQETLYQGITWNLNPPTASHFGGCWESQIRVVKNHLRRTIGDVLLTYEELLTVLTQVEAMINSRPLTVLSSDPAEPEALTPAHFLTFGPLDSFHSDPRLDSVDLIRNKRLLDAIVQRYWNRWRREYLNTLQSRVKWNTKSNPVTKGTVVLIKTENSPPLQWPIGVIDDVKPSSDGVVRVATVRTRNGTYVRPVVKLCVLPSQ